MSAPDMLKANTANLDAYTNVHDEVNNKLTSISTINVIGFVIIAIFILLSIIYMTKSNKSRLLKTIIGLLLIIVPITILLIINLVILS